MAAQKFLSFKVSSMRAFDRKGDMKERPFPALRFLPLSDRDGRKAHIADRSLDCSQIVILQGGWRG
jgi:hypothetical protein